MNSRARYLMAVGICILGVQAMASYGLHRAPFLPSPPPLRQLPFQLGGWTAQGDERIESEVLEMLGPDDSLARGYHRAAGSQNAALLVAYYRTQLLNKTAHDPKVCLPGAGWNPVASRVIPVPSRNGSTSFPANYYRIAKDGTEAVVLYWFQTYNGVYIYEQQLRAHRVIDSVLANRTDVALVRIMVPVNANGISAADSSATELAQLVFAEMLAYFPVKENAGS